MPDTEISRLAELPANLLEETDVLAIVDTSASETKKIRATSLISGTLDDLPPGTIDPDLIDWDTADPSVIDGNALKDRSVAAVKIELNSLTASEIAANAIGSAELADLSVDTAAIQGDAVTADKIADDQIGDEHIVTSGLGTGSIANGAITRVKMTLNDDDIDGSVITSNSISAKEIAPNAIGSSELADGAVDTRALQNLSVTSDKIASNAILDRHILDAGLATSSIADGAITRVKMTLNNDDIDGSVIAGNSITANELAPNSVGESELRDNSVDTAALQTSSVTTDKLGPDSVVASKISSGAVGTSELSALSCTTEKIANAAVTTDKLANRSVTSAKLASNLPGSILENGSIDTNQLADEAVTEAKILDGSITTDKLSTGAVTDVKVTNVSGGKIDTATIQADKFASSAFGGGIEVDGVVRHINDIDAGSNAGISWDEHGHVVGFNQVPPEDLPLATATSPGIIEVPSGSGLTVSATGEIDHVTLIGEGTVSGISFDEHGHITNAEALSFTDLPVATNITIGAVKIPTTNSNPLTVAGDGGLTHAVNGITAGTYVSVDVDQYGHVTAGDAVLTPNQVPGISADKITSGQFPTARLEDDAVTMPKLADFSVSFIQEAQPELTVDLHIGCLWYQESTAQLRMYNGNSFMPVGFGRLAQENLRFGGTINAATGLIVALTDSGRTAGLEIGGELPSATDALGGLYVVVSDAGSNISVVPGTAFDAGDWCLCVNETEGWIRIDTLNGGGGGGGLIRLNDLLDVDINSPGAGDTLIYDPTTGQWTNRTTTADRVTMSPAFDGTTTAFTLSMDILDQNNVLLSVGGVIMEPSVDFQIESGTRNLNFATPPPEGSPYFLMNQQTVNATSGGGGGGGTDLPPGSAANELLQWDNNLGTWGPTAEIDGGSF